MKLFFKTIRGKIIILTSMITLMITIITISVCFLVFQHFLRKNQIQSAEYNLQTASTQITSDLNDILLLSKWMTSNHEILRYLELVGGKPELAISAKENRLLSFVALSSHNRMKEEFYSNRSNEHIVRAIIAAENQKNFLQVMPTGNANHSQAPQIIAAKQYFQRLYQHSDYHWIGIVQDPLTHMENQPVIPIIRPIYHQYDTSTLGWIYLSISPTIITNHLKTYPLAADSRLHLTIGEHTYALSGQNLQEITLDYTAQSAFSSQTLNPESAAQVIHLSSGERQVIVTVPIGIDGWYLSEILSQQQLQRQRSIYISLIGIICIVMLSLGVVLVILLNYMITRPVGMLRKKIDAISVGDFSPDPTIEWEHELGEIGQGINHLSQNVVTLMERRIADEKQKKDLEYQILQSQINPHFLYNTLNSIKWMATIQNATGIAEMTTALARLMKNVSKGTSALIPLKEELDLVKDYFLIQQYRYGGSISLTCEIESTDLLQCSLHRFSLQPLIENALFHGIEPKGTNGHITITVQKLLLKNIPVLQICITDDGVGISPEQIDRILLGTADNKTDFFKQIGIAAVNQRIKYEFGKDYGIQISSRLGHFTTMTIQMPCLMNIQPNNGGDS